MGKTKRILSFFIALIMVLALVPFNAIVYAVDVETGDEAQTQAPSNEKANEDLPSASVSRLPTETIKEFTIFDKFAGGANDFAEILNPQVLMQFVAKDTAESAANSAYAKYIADFYITVEGLSQATYGKGCYLVGHYEGYGWYAVPLDGIEVENAKYPVMSSIAAKLTYEEICTSVKDFKCGIYFAPEFIEANPNMKVSLELGLSETFEQAEKAEFTRIGDAYTYTAKDLGLPNAIINKIPPVSVNEYTVYNKFGGNVKVEGTLDPQVLMQFIAQDTEESAKYNAYANYLADFYIKLDGLAQETAGTGCYLIGYYEGYDWYVVPLDGITVNNGTYPVMSSIAAKLPYTEICASVKDFKCGIYFSDAFIASNPNVSVSLELGLSETFEQAEKAEYIKIGDTYTYTVEDLTSDAPVFIPDELTGTVVDEIKNNTSLDEYTPVNVPEGAELVIELVSVDGKIVYDVTPMANGEKVEKLTGAITFRLPVPASIKATQVKVYHDGTLMGTYSVMGADNAKYVEISSDDFSEFAIEPVEAAPVVEVTDANGNVTYYAGFTGFSELDLANCTIKLIGNVSDANLILNKGKESKVVDVNVVLDLNGFTFARTGSTSGAINLTNGSSLTIKDTSAEKTGKIITDTYAVWVMNGDLTIEGGTIETTSTKNAALYLNASETVISGGKIISAGNAITVGENFIESRGTSNVAISGGEIKAAGDIIVKGGYAQEESKAVVTGGTFSKDVSDYCADGFECKANADGTFGVAEKNNSVAEVNGVGYKTLTEALKAVTNDSQTVTILSDITENLSGAYLRGNIVTANDAKVTITLTNADWVACPYTFVLGENITLNIPNGGIFYYAGGAVIKGTVVTAWYYQRYAGTKLTIEAPGSMTVTSETCIIRYMDNDANAGIYIVGDDNDETVELKLDVAYFYQGMINAKDATIVCGTYWQTNDTDGTGSANLVLDNSTLTVTVYDYPAKATGNSTVTLKNGSTMNCANGGFAYGDNAKLDIDATSVIIDKGNKPVVVPVASVNGVGYATLEEAFAAAQNGDEVVILVAGTYTVPSGKDITITGAVDSVVFDNIKKHAMGGASVTFNNVTFNYSMTEGHNGLQHSGDLVYNNCTFKGQVFLYGTSETFNNCRFNQTDVNNYNVWTYAADDVKFNGCKFYSAGRSLLIYSEGADLYANVVITDCDFISSNAVDGKAAIEMDSSLSAGIKVTIDAATTATGFGNGNVSGNSLWNNKKGNETAANNDITVVVNGVTVLAPVTYVAEVNGVKYESLVEAFAAAQAGDTIKLLADVTTSTIIVINKAITLDGNGKTLTSTAARAINVSGADGVTIKNLTIKASGERAINIIQNATNVTIENVTATAANYTVNVASSAPNAVVAIKNSTLNGLCTVNVASAGAKVTVDNSTINCNDNNTTAGESYAALGLNKDAVGGSIIATNTTVNVAEGSDSVKGKNGAENGTITINGSTEDVFVAVAVITYAGQDNYYSFYSLAEAIEFAKAGDTITLIRNVTLSKTIVINKSITLDGNGHKINTTASRAINIDTENGELTVTIKDLEIVGGKGCQRGINIIDNSYNNTPANVTLDGVKMTGISTYGVQLADSVGSNNTITIKNSEIHSWIALNINGDNQTVTVTNSKLYGAAYAANDKGNTITVGGNNTIVTINGGILSASTSTGLAGHNCGHVVGAESNIILNNVETIVAKDGDAVITYAVAKIVGKDGTYVSLAEALAKAQAGETVVLLRDVTIDKLVKIEKAITLDLNGKKVTSTAQKAFEIYANATIKNGTIEAAQRCVDTRKAVELTLTDVKLIADKYTSYGNTQPLTIGGSENGTKVTLTNVNISSAAGYGIITFVKTELTATNSTIGGYSALYVKTGSDNSTFSFVNCDLTGSTASNDVEGNSFSTIAIRANNVTVTVDANSTVTANGEYCAAISVIPTVDNGETSANANVTVYGEITGKVFSGKIGNNSVKVNASCVENIESTYATIPAENGLVAIATGVASVGDVVYATLQDAINAAKDGDTIVLVADIADSATIKIVNKSITIDLAGHIISGTCNAGQASLIYIENNASLTVKDTVGEGKITYAQGTSNVGWTIDVKGEFVLESGTIELTGSWSIGYAVEVRPNSWGTEYTSPSVFTMNGGNIVSSDGGVRVASSSYEGHKNVSASFVMNGGKIDAAWDGVFIQQSDAIYDDLSFTMNGGTIESDLNPIRVYGPAPTSYVNGQNCMKITLAGGTMTYTGAEAQTWVIEGILRVGGGSSIETILENGTIAVSADIAESVAAPEGYKWVANGNAYTLAECNYVAEANGVKYETLQDAIKAGGTVVLLTDIELEAPVTVTGTVVLELNGKTISQTKAQTGNYSMITNDGILTIQDTVGGGKISYTDTVGGNFVSNTIMNRGTLTLKSGRIENMSSQAVANAGFPYAIDTSIWGAADTVVTNIEGGVVYCASYSAIRLRADSETEAVNVTISGGEIYGRIEVQNPQSKTASAGKLTITDGIINKNNSSMAIMIFGGGAAATNMKMEITGGEFVGAIGYSTYFPITGFDEKAISGGTFDTDVSAFCADGYTCVANGDGTYSVEEKPQIEIVRRGTSISLDGSFYINYYIYNNSYASLKGNIYAVVQLTHKDCCGGADEEAYIIKYNTDKWVVNAINGADAIIIEDIVAKNMGCTVTIDFYVGNPDDAIEDTFVSAHKTSVMEHAYNVLNNTNAKDDYKQSMYDMLNYGAAAQVRFNHATNNLVNAKLGNYTQYARGENENAVNTDVRVDTKGTEYYYGSSLVLEGTTSIVVYLKGVENFGDKITAVATYKTFKGKQITITVDKAVTTTAGGATLYGFQFSGIASADLDSLMDIKFYYNGETIFETTYSIAAHAAVAKDANNGRYEYLYQALLNFNQSAKAYLKRLNNII